MLYSVTMITEDNEDNTPQEEFHKVQREDPLPIGIARIREEWRAAGLVEQPEDQEREDAESVIFPEINGGAGIGDYTLECDTVKDKLALSREAVVRLVTSGTLDSILVQDAQGHKRRLVSESSLRRFEDESAIDPNAVNRVARTMADKGVRTSIEDLQDEVEELRSTQSKILQQMKDVLLLEVRNLKEQDRDLASFVYELAEEIRANLPKKKKKK